MENGQKIAAILVRIKWGGLGAAVEAALPFGRANQARTASATPTTADPITTMATMVTMPSNLQKRCRPKRFEKAGSNPGNGWHLHAQSCTLLTVEQSCACNIAGCIRTNSLTCRQGSSFAKPSKHPCFHRLGGGVLTSLGRQFPPA